MDGILFTSREESAKEVMFFAIFFDANDLEYSENTYHEESVFILMMPFDKRIDLSSKVHSDDKQ